MKGERNPWCLEMESYCCCGGPGCCPLCTSCRKAKEVHDQQQENT